MKGYNTPEGFMGYVDGKYLLFCSEGEYLDYVQETAWEGASLKKEVSG